MPYSSSGHHASADHHGAVSSDDDDGDEGDGIQYHESAGSRLLRSLRKQNQARSDKRRRIHKYRTIDRQAGSASDPDDGSNTKLMHDRTLDSSDDENLDDFADANNSRGMMKLTRGGKDIEKDDHDDDSMDEGDDGSNGLDWDPFEDRFVTGALPLPASEDERRVLMEQRLSSVETVLTPDPSLVLQASSALLDRLEIHRGSGDGQRLVSKCGTDGKVGAQATPNPALPRVDVQFRRLARSFFRKMRPVLQSNWSNGGTAGNNRRGADPANGPSLQPPSSSLLLYPCVASYADVLATNETSRKVRLSNLRTVTVHILSHVLRSRELVRRHDRQLLMRQQKDAEDNIDVDARRDQGFTRPTVLILAPTRSGCYELVNLLQSLLLDRHPQHSSDTDDFKASHVREQGQRRREPSDETDPAFLERFIAEYGPPQEKTPEFSNRAPNEGDGNEEGSRRRRQILRHKGLDWLELFGDEANGDDDFKLGLAIQRSGDRSSKGAGKAKYCVKLFTDFYRSDIIVASPLGLKILLENKGGGNDDEDEDGMNQSLDERRNGRDSQRGYDFLSSIEICYIARADVLLMQNWDHVSDVVRLLNEQPRCSTAIDYSRVRPYHLHDGQSQHWRQLIVTSTFVDPMILNLFKRHAKSLAGSVRIRRKTLDASEASIARVVLPTRQVFQLIPTQSLVDHASDRVRYFCDSVLPEIIRQKQKHTLVFIPSYFDFVSVRNVMLKREVDFVSVTEYSRVSEVSRGRARFLQGRMPIMLYTGRAHFFHRHAIKGVRHLIFLGLPEYAEFYSGMVNSLNDEIGTHGDKTLTGSHEASCLVLFTKYEGFALERIIGSQNSCRILRGDTSTYLF
jgi:U3 small nucleolar RNA-associated protein 25